MERYSVIHTKMPREFVLLQGRGCKPNREKAAKWFKKAAEKNHARSQQKLEEMNQSK